MLACILFVFGALTEYAILLFRRGMIDETEEDEAAGLKNQKRLKVEMPPGVKVGFVTLKI
jgi:hypothetical protein